MLTFYDMYRKQSLGEQSTIVIDHLEKDDNMFIHQKQSITYTPKEAARVQSFPDGPTFEGKMSKKFRQIGNAMSPRMDFAISESICVGITK